MSDGASDRAAKDTMEAAGVQAGNDVGVAAGANEGDGEMMEISSAGSGCADCVEVDIEGANVLSRMALQLSGTQPVILHAQ
jgi:hypothetical protein